MRFIHFADTHLGFSEYSKIDSETGVNQREQDFYTAWWHSIESIIQHQPDFVLHAGDLFQSPRPNNRSIAIALAGLKRLNEANIPIVLIAGNHSTPRIRATGSIFEALTVLPNVQAAFNGVYEKFSIQDKESGKLCVIHCIPHCSLSEDLEKAYAAVEPDQSAQWNILMTHGCWRAAGKIDTRMGEFNEQFIEDPEVRLNVTFDYIALGHYHRYIEINDHTYYSGSTERTSFNETGYTSGYIVGDLSTRGWEYQQIPSRPMLRLKAIDCHKKHAEDIILELEQRQRENDVTGAMISIELNHLTRDLYLQLDLQAIDKIFSHAFHLEKRMTLINNTSEDKKKENSEQLSIGSLRDEFSRYLSSHTNDTIPREDLENLGWKYIAEAESTESGE